MTTVPPLPESGQQTPENRTDISRRFIIHARKELQDGNRLQAGEKAWGAVAQQLKIIGEQRGWEHSSHGLLEAIGRQIAAEHGHTDLSNALGDAYNGHKNFYENQSSVNEISRTIQEVEEILPFLESLQFQAPPAFTITSNQQLRRLTLLTGNPDLRIGDSSPTGFSRRH